MKELSIEEKARRFDEVLAMAKEQHQYPWVRKVRDVLEELFPELEEDEDDKIIDAIRKALESKIEDLGNGVTKTSCLAWLEKQGEQKFANKFHEGDYIVNDYCMGRIVEITNDAYRLDTGIEIPLSCHSTRLWDITKDAKDGDLIYVSTKYMSPGEKGIQAIFDEFDNGIIYFHCDLYGGKFTRDCYMPMGDVELVMPLPEIHHQRFFKKMNEAGYEWDAYKKKLNDIPTPKFKM